MVEMTPGDHESFSVFTLTPNRSLSWKWVKRVFWFFVICLALVSGYFASQGAWLVLPFAGLEAGVLGLGLYLSARWSSNREIVSLEGSELRVLRGCNQLQEVARLSRHWTRVALRSDPRGWYPSRLFLESHGRRIEIGPFLVESERVQLAADLHSKLKFEFTTNHIEPRALAEGFATAEQKI